MATKIEYADEVLTTIRAGQVITLECQDKRMRGNIVITQDSPPGAIDLSNIPEVESIDNPTEESPTAVIYQGEIYFLCEEEIKNG